MTVGNQTHMPRRRRFPKGTATRRLQLFVTQKEEADLVAQALEANTSLSEMMTTATLAPTGGISRAEKTETVTALIETRDAIGSLVIALRETGELTPGMRDRLRTIDDRLFNFTESLS